jgi:hypothetical protein
MQARDMQTTFALCCFQSITPWLSCRAPNPNPNPRSTGCTPTCNTAFPLLLSSLPLSRHMLAYTAPLQVLPMWQERTRYPKPKPKPKPIGADGACGCTRYPKPKPKPKPIGADGACGCTRYPRAASARGRWPPRPPRSRPTSRGLGFRV